MDGSAHAIAALCSSDGRHLAMMPHPERCFLRWQWPWMPAGWSQLEASPWLRLFQNAAVRRDPTPDPLPPPWLADSATRLSLAGVLPPARVSSELDRALVGTELFAVSRVTRDACPCVSAFVAAHVLRRCV